MAPQIVLFISNKAIWVIMFSVDIFGRSYVMISKSQILLLKFAK